MGKIYFTIAGTKYHFGQEYFEPKMEVKLVKEPDNEYDKEAIKVEMDGLGLVGYVANGLNTNNDGKGNVLDVNPKFLEKISSIARFALPICVSESKS